MRLERFEFSQIRMGVDTPIIVYAPSEAQALEACRAAYTRISQLEQQMSDYRLDSELNAVCKEAVSMLAAGEPRAVLCTVAGASAGAADRRRV
jgi:hypothetical protein